MKKIIILITLIVSASNISGQGCSDAGICSIDRSFHQNEKVQKNQIEFASIFGTGEADVTYFSPYVAYTRHLNNKLSLNAKVTFSSANGSFGTRASLGDAYLIGNYRLNENNNKQWSFLSGFKLPFNTSNLKINKFSIPLDYQSSLGTFDFFLGSNLKYKKFDFNAAIQIPVINNNKNSYFKEFSKTDDFPTTNLFERKSDALLRATYTLKTENKKFTFRPNVLFIYHLGNDSFENIFGKREEIIGSEGLTINANLVTAYDLNKSNSLELSLAAPLVIREARPDGLTRGFVASLHYRVAF